MDDSANHSTPTIRHYVKLEMKRREVEMEVIKQEVVKDQDENSVEKKDEVVVVTSSPSQINQEIVVNSSTHPSPQTVEVEKLEKHPSL